MVTQIEPQPQQKKHVRADKWSMDDLEYLRGHAGIVDIDVLAHRLDRSPMAVYNKIVKLHLLPDNTSNSNSYKIADVAYMLGRTEETVKRWIAGGSLKSRKYGQFTVNDLKTFIVKYPQEIDQNKMDFICVLDILVGGKDGLRGYLATDR